MKGKYRSFYLFLGFCLPALARGQAGTTLLVKTDMSCEWKLDGQPMGLLKADDSKVVLVSPGEHLIEAVAIEGVATLRTKVEVAQTEKSVELGLKSHIDQQSKMQDTGTAHERAGAAPGPTWIDPSTSLMWTLKDNGSELDWNQATAYCSKLQLAGYSDWRLPTIDELQSMYDPGISIRKKFDNGVTYDVHVKGNLILSGWHWSSSMGNRAREAWGFVFGIEQPRRSVPLGFSFSMRALCVRSAAGDVSGR